MLYRPKYCCSCGEAIERTEWRVFTSRRFCELCETEHVLADWSGRLAGLILVLVGLIGFGGYLLSPAERIEIRRPNSSLLSLKPNAAEAGSSANAANRADDGKHGPAADRSPVGEAPVANPPESREVTSGKTSRGPVVNGRTQMAASEPVFYCGAETKKGAPCSRKVKGGGRCWQHKGRKAVLPKEKLLIKGHTGSTAKANKR